MQDYENPRAVSLLRGARPSSNVFETTVERIRRSIGIGLFKPGQQLPPERELAELMGASRTTVRAAIKVLVQGGFLEVRRGRTGGTFVSGSSPLPADGGKLLGVEDPQVREILDRRRVLETGAAELAAERITKENLATLRGLVGQMMEQVNDRDSFRQTDVQFHIALAESTENQWLVREIAEVQADIGGLISMIPPSDDAMTNSNAQHARIVAHLAKHDGERARREIAEHLAGTERLLHGLLPGE